MSPLSSNCNRTSGWMRGATLVASYLRKCLILIFIVGVGVCAKALIEHAIILGNVAIPWISNRLHERSSVFSEYKTLTEWTAVSSSEASFVYELGIGRRPIGTFVKKIAKKEKRYLPFHDLFPFAAVLGKRVMENDKTNFVGAVWGQDQSLLNSSRKLGIVCYPLRQTGIRIVPPQSRREGAGIIDAIFDLQLAVLTPIDLEIRSDHPRPINCIKTARLKIRANFGGGGALGTRISCDRGRFRSLDVGPHGSGEKEQCGNLDYSQTAGQPNKSIFERFFSSVVAFLFLAFIFSGGAGLSLVWSAWRRCGNGIDWWAIPAFCLCSAGGWVFFCCAFSLALWGCAWRWLFGSGICGY